jgi:hypothetical protein
MIDPLLLKGWVLILVGAFFIALGGVLTTLGWQRLGDRSQKRSLIAAVTRELEINDTLLANPVFTSDDQAVLKSALLYPRFRSSATNNILTSGLFDPTLADDRVFVRAVADYQESANDTNSRLNVSDNYIVATWGTDKSAVASHRKQVRESNGLTGFIAQSKLLNQLLTKQYPWVASEKFLNTLPSDQPKQVVPK